MLQIILKRQTEFYLTWILATQGPPMSRSKFVGGSLGCHSYMPFRQVEIRLDTFYQLRNYSTVPAV